MIIMVKEDIKREIKKRLLTFHGISLVVGKLLAGSNVRWNRC